MKDKNNSLKSRVAVEVKARWKVGEEKEEKFEFDYECVVTVEQIQYAVRQIASTIASVASKIAEQPEAPATAGSNGAHKSTNGKRSVKPAEATQ